MSDYEPHRPRSNNVRVHIRPPEGNDDTLARSDARLITLVKQLSAEVAKLEERVADLEKRFPGVPILPGQLIDKPLATEDDGA